MTRVKLVIASGNEGKVAEFRGALSTLNVEVLSAGELGVTTFPPETGSSYEENALLKAGYASLQTKLPALGDDSGLEVEALRGAPGLYSARFGGDLSPGERTAHLLEKLRRVPQGERGARFVCSLVLATPRGGLHTFEGRCEGEILQGPRGTAGFGYDPVFYSHDLQKSFAEATPEEKRRVSHRGRAVQKLLEWAKGEKIFS